MLFKDLREKIDASDYKFLSVTQLDRDDNTVFEGLYDAYSVFIEGQTVDCESRRTHVMINLKDAKMKYDGERRTFDISAKNGVNYLLYFHE